MLAAIHRLHDSKRITYILMTVSPIVESDFLIFREHTGDAVSRFAFIASKKVGKSVERHRAVRLLREAIKVDISRIVSGYDVVIVARRSVLQSSLDQLQKHIHKTLHTLGLLNSLPLQGSVE